MRGLAPTNAPPRQLVIFSAGAGQLALDRLGFSDKETNGLFTRVLINRLLNTDSTIDREMRKVRREVVELAQSVGHEQVPFIADQSLGDFYFKSKETRDAGITPDVLAVSSTQNAPSNVGNAWEQAFDATETLRPSQSVMTGEKSESSIENDKRVALVIGNASYKYAPLDNPLNDATDIANELKRRGFKVISRNNANLRSLQQAVRDFSDEFKKSDVGLIYYSGHGVETKGQNYLIPVDADIRKEYELSAQAYPASQLTDMMEECQYSDGKKRVAILILDACRDNPLTRSWRSSGRGLERMDAPSGTFISFTKSQGSVASDGRGRNSPFTKHLLQAMRKPDVPIELMFKQVRVGVMDETKGEQIPWDSSSLTGDFYFSRSNARQ